MSWRFFIFLRRLGYRLWLGSLFLCFSYFIACCIVWVSTIIRRERLMIWPWVRTKFWWVFTKVTWVWFCIKLVDFGPINIICLRPSFSCRFGCLRFCLLTSGDFLLKRCSQSWFVESHRSLTGTYPRLNWHTASPRPVYPSTTTFLVTTWQ